jgi:hypothetical protein
MSPARRLLLAGVFMAAVAGCAITPIIKHRTYEKADGLFRTVAVVPFTAGQRLAVSLRPGGVTAGEASQLVARFVVEAFQAQGIRVIPASDVERAFAASGGQSHLADAATAAAVTARKFGATGIVRGVVLRYRERDGGPRGALRPASVAFQLTLYTAPAGVRVWSARFDETQPALSDDPLRVRLYPGRGTRWLSAAELTRWGADEALAVIPESIR